MKLGYVAYWKPFNFNNISLIIGIGYGFHFNYLFRFLKSLIRILLFNLGLGCAKYGDPHSESFYTSRTPNRTKFSTSFLKLYSCTFGTGYGRSCIVFASSFNLNSTGSVFQVPSVPLNNSSNICNYFFQFIALCHC